MKIELRSEMNDIWNNIQHSEWKDTTTWLKRHSERRDKNCSQNVKWLPFSCYWTISMQNSVNPLSIITYSYSYVATGFYREGCWVPLCASNVSAFSCILCYLFEINAPKIVLLFNKMGWVVRGNTPLFKYFWNENLR